jgi:hypothetical protein
VIFQDIAKGIKEKDDTIDLINEVKTAGNKKFKYFMQNVDQF